MQLILTVFLAILAGLVTAPFYSVPPILVWIGAGSLVLLRLLLNETPRTNHVVFALLFFLLANLNYSYQVMPSRSAVAIDQLNRKLVVSGNVLNVVHLDDERSRIDVAVGSILSGTDQIENAEGLTIRLYLEQGKRLFLPGDNIRFKSRLRLPRLFKIPGEFNWPRYLSSQDIDLTGWVKSDSAIDVISREEGGWLRKIAVWKEQLAAFIQAEVPLSRAPLVRALLLGEGRVLPAEVRQVLSHSGISHLFAISGLHLGMIALLMYRAGLFVYRRHPALLEWCPPQRSLPLMLLPLLFFYLILTGDAVSTRRAFALAFLGAIFLLKRNYVNPVMLLVSLATLSLLINPLLLWQASWQLSFAGAAGILLTQPLWQHNFVVRRMFWCRYSLQLFLVTCAASLTTLPLVLMNFHLIAPAGLFANMICVPVVTLVILPVGLSGLVLFMLWPNLSASLFYWCGYLLHGLVDLAGWFTELPGLSGYSLFLSRWQYLSVGLFLLALLLLLRKFHGLKSSVGVGGALMMAALLWVLPGSGSESEGVSLTMFSVGQGDSLLLQNRSGQAVLVDGGGLYSQRFDVGERLLAPALAEMRITHLDAVVLTHDHPDHRKGLIYVLDNFSVGRFVTFHPLKDLHPLLRNVLIEKQVPVFRVDAGWHRLSFWQRESLMVHNGFSGRFKENDNSLVVYLGLGSDDGILLTGDLEARGVETLMRAGVPGPVSVLKLPHHGSRYSLTDKLVERLMPRYCLASVGYQNRYRLPARDVVNMVAGYGLSLFRTDRDGTVRLSFGEAGWSVRQWDNGLFR